MLTFVVLFFPFFSSAWCLVVIHCVVCWLKLFCLYPFCRDEVPSLPFFDPFYLDLISLLEHARCFSFVMMSLNFISSKMTPLLLCGAALRYGLVFNRFFVMSNDSMCNFILS